METQTEKALVLRTCAADMTSYGGFRWPESGPVSCPDWNPKPACGNGLHGLLWGEGEGGLVSWAPESRWLVVEVDRTTVVELSGKVKFPAGVVVFCGDRLGATEYLAANGGAGRAIVGGTATAGDGGTATAGDGGTATAGDGGTATAGYRGTATAGDGGTATAGYRGTLMIRRYDYGADRYRSHSADVGENGILPNVAYRLNDKGLFVPAEVQS